MKNTTTLLLMLLSALPTFAQSEAASNHIPDWTGTCFAITRNMVVTNYHVVGDAQSLFVCGTDAYSSGEWAAEIVVTDKFNDLAVVRITDPNFAGFNIKYGFKSQVADMGTDIFVLGYPLIGTMGTDIKLTTGVVSAKTGFAGDVSLYQISAPVQPGNSGGPLFDSEGNVIGIINAKHGGAENVAYAIKTSYLNILLDSAIEPISINSTNKINTLSLSEKVKAIAPCVMLVKACTSSAHQAGSGLIDRYGVSEAQASRAQEWLESAGQKLEKKDYYGSYADVCRAVELHPTPIGQYLKAFLAYFHVDEVDAAIEALEYCLENQYRESNCLSMLAHCYADKEDYEKAIQYLDRAIAMDRKDISSLYLRAFCKSQLDRNDEAIADYRQAVKFDGIVDYDFSLIYNNLAYQLMKQDNYAEALIYIKQSIKADGLYGNAWDTYGELNYRMGNFQECIMCMDIAITNGLTFEDAHWLSNSYLYRGLAKKELGNLSGAYKDLNRADGLGEEDAAQYLAEFDLTQLDLDADGTYDVMYKNLRIAKRGDTDLQIRGVEVTNEFTALHLYWANNKYDPGWYYIAPEAYIIDKTTGIKYPLIAAENCAIGPEHTTLEKGKAASFTLYFKAIPPKTKKIDFIESDDSQWKFTGIELK